MFKRPDLSPAQRPKAGPSEIPARPTRSPVSVEPEPMQSFYEVELVLKRGRFGNSSGQIGELFDERGEFLCHILEDPNQEPKVWGETAIPAGIYEIEANEWQGRAAKHARRWAWHSKEIWHLKDVKGFEYIQIHPGNVPADTLGCLLPGRWDGRGVRVLSSAAAYRMLYQRYEKQVRAGVVKIRIEDM